MFVLISAKVGVPIRVVGGTVEDMEEDPHMEDMEEDTHMEYMEEVVDVAMGAVV